MMQLDLLTYFPAPVERIEAPPLPPLVVNPLVAAHHQKKAAVYLAIANQMAKGERLPANIRRHEINRLLKLREIALEACNAT